MRVTRTGVLYLSLLVIAMTGILWLVLGNTVDVGDAAVALLPPLPGIFLAWASFRADRMEAHAGQDAAKRVADASEALADAVRRQWTVAAQDRILLDPAPIAVRWSWARRVAGPPEERVGTSQVWGPFEPLPGVDAVGPGAVREGGLDDLFRIYGGLRSGFTVVLGGVGSGKSEAAVLTVLTALRRRGEQLDADPRAHFPVPVLLSLSGWDGRNLDDWLIGRLRDDYPFLLAAYYGADAAAQLVRSGQVALFLDGFDELDRALRPAALETIRGHDASRVVLFSRTDAFEDAGGAGRMGQAAVLELSPVRREDAAEYLRRCKAHSSPAPWHRLMTHLSEEPDSVVSGALTSPLALSLLRDVVRRDPTQVNRLLAPGGFAAPNEVVDHLVASFVNVAYMTPHGATRGGYDPQDARRWLGYLANRMTAQGTRSLDWRRLHWWEPLLPRVVISGVAGLVVSAIGGAIAFGQGGYYIANDHGAWSGIFFGIFFGIVLGLVFGLATGTASEFRDLSPDWRLRLRGLGGTRWHGFNRPAGFNPAAGVLVGLTVALVVGNHALDDYGPWAYLFGLVAGIGVGGTAGFAAMRTHPDPARVGRWKAVRSHVALATGLTAGIPIGASFWGTHSQNVGPGHVHGSGAGLTAGLVATLVIGLMVGGTRPSARTDTLTAPVTSWRRARRAGLVMGLVFGSCVGLAFGINNAAKQCCVPTGGLLGVLNDVFFVFVGAGIAFGLGAVITVSDHWRTSLLFLQLRFRRHFPGNGMRFLKDAYDRGLLRAEGPRYQFRHARFQERLSIRTPGGSG